LHRHGIGREAVGVDPPAWSDSGGRIRHTADYSLKIALTVLGFAAGWTAFAPNHKDMPVPTGDEELDYVRRQVLTARNVHGIASPTPSSAG
jgi:hypothetical protein